MFALSLQPFTDFPIACYLLIPAAEVIIICYVCIYKQNEIL